MIKLYIGGSPCTHWSCAQTKNRETEPSGLGWELFENYVIGLRKYKPDYFLYENNKSMSPAIREQITKELGVEPILINSALVSAQNRQRLYWTNIPGVIHPEDKGILLRDILETGTAWKEKAYTLDAHYYKTVGEYNPTKQHSYSRHMVAEPVYPFGTNDEGKAYTLTASYWKGPLPENTLERKQRSMVAEPVRIGTIESGERGKVSDSQANRVYSPYAKSVTLLGQGGGAGAKTGLYAVPVNTTAEGKAQCLRSTCYKDGIRNLVGNDVDKKTCVAIPCAARQVGRRVGEDGKRHDYDESIEHYQRIEINEDPNKTNCLTSVQKDNLVIEQYEELVPYVERKINEIVDKYGYLPERFNPYNLSEITDKTPTLTANMARQTSSATVFNIIKSNGKEYLVYEVHNGLITIKNKQYQIKLPDGYYIIRKLTVKECMRLQTIPDTYIFPVSDSQAYKMLGNGWTVDIIAHQLSFIPGITTEEIEVLSMYDGMSCGHIALDKLGVNVIRYYASEIDKYAIQTAKHNYPMMEHIGDAYQVREPDWRFTAKEGKSYELNVFIGQMSIEDWLTLPHHS